MISPRAEVASLWDEAMRSRSSARTPPMLLMEPLISLQGFDVLQLQGFVQFADPELFIIGG